MVGNGQLLLSRSLLGDCELKINRRQFLKYSAAATTAIGVSSKAQAMELALGNDSYNYIKRGAPRERVFSCSPLHPHANPVEAWVDDDPMAPNNPLTNKKGRRIVEISGVTRIKPQQRTNQRGRIDQLDATRRWRSLA